MSEYGDKYLEVSDLLDDFAEGEEITWEVNRRGQQTLVNAICAGMDAPGVYYHNEQSVVFEFYLFKRIMSLTVSKDNLSLLYNDGTEVGYRDQEKIGESLSTAFQNLISRFQSTLGGTTDE